MKSIACASVLAAGFLSVAPPAGGRSGLLLGVEVLQGSQSDWTPAPQWLQTYWITRDASEARVERILPGLIVPQAHGFKRLMVKRTCTIVREVPEHPFQRCEDTYAAADLSAPPPPLPADRYEDDGPCSYGLTRIDFASPLAVALRTYGGNNEACEPRGFHWTEHAWIQALDGHHLSVSDVAGAAGRVAYAAAVRKAAVEESKVWEHECPSDPTADDQWTVARRDGQWRGRVFQADTPPCDISREIALRLPATLTGPDRLAVAWRSIKKAVPDAADAVSSPDGTWTLLVTGSQLLVMTGTDLTRRKTVSALAKPPDAGDEVNGSVRIVMAQWAVGDRNVARWSAALR